MKSETKIEIDKWIVGHVSRGVGMNTDRSLSITIWENKSLPILSSFRKAIYCEQLFWDSKTSRQLHCPHMPQLFASICDMAAAIGFLILSLLKSAFCFGGHCIC